MKLSIEPLSQNDFRWKSKKLGSSSVTIGGYGCLLTCHSMLLTYFGHIYLPDSLNDLYKEKGVYQDTNLINYWKIPSVFSDISCPSDGYLECPDTAAPLDIIDLYLNKGVPVIAKVDFDTSTTTVDSHFILIVGKDNDEYLINDPQTGECYYFSACKYAKYKDPAKDIYGLRIYTGPVSVEEDNYKVTYKGQTLATYETNPIDKIDELQKQVNSLKETVAEEVQNNATLQSALTQQEKDNADLVTQIRTANTDRDNALASFKEVKGLAKDILGIDPCTADQFRAVLGTLDDLRNENKRLTSELANNQSEFKFTRLFGKYYLAVKNG
jgi:hypothetical protein